MKIEEMNRGNMEGIVALENECFAHPWTLDNLIEYYSNSNAHFFVAKEDDKIVGYVGSYTVMDECFVTNIAVTESARGQGVASALLEKLISVAEASKASFITLEVRFSNLPAIGLYKKYGFTLDGTRPGFYRDPEEDALIMTKRFL